MGVVSGDRTLVKFRSPLPTPLKNFVDALDSFGGIVVPNIDQHDSPVRGQRHASGLERTHIGVTARNLCAYLCVQKIGDRDSGQNSNNRHDDK